MYILGHNTECHLYQWNVSVTSRCDSHSFFRGTGISNKICTQLCCALCCYDYVIIFLVELCDLFAHIFQSFFIGAGVIRVKSPQELGNPLSKAVPGKFQGSDWRSKCKYLQDSQFSHVLGLANCPNFSHWVIIIRLLQMFTDDTKTEVLFPSILSKSRLLKYLKRDNEYIYWKNFYDFDCLFVCFAHLSVHWYHQIGISCVFWKKMKWNQMLGLGLFYTKCGKSGSESPRDNEYLLYYIKTFVHHIC